jgi:hypothetical protein
MVLLRAAGLCRLALRTQWASMRLLSAAAGGGELSAGEDRRRRVDLEALRRERAERPPAAREPPTSPLPSRYTSNLGRTNDWTVALNAEIQACASAEAVLDLVAPQLERLSAVNACTALLTIQRRAGGAATWLDEDARFTQLLEHSARVFERMAPRNLSNSLYACAKLGITPPDDWLQRFWHFSAVTMATFQGQHFSNTMYACGLLGIVPPAVWMERFWLASAAQLGHSQFDPQALSNTLYACGLLGLTPPEYWLARYWLASASRLGEFVPQALSNTIYACGRLAVMPPEYWLQRFWLAGEPKLVDHIPQDFANTLYSCGLLGLTPPDAWLESYWHASAAKLLDPGFCPQSASITMYACGQLRITPPADWMALFWRSMAPKMGEFKPQELSNTLQACGLLGITPAPEFLESYWRVPLTDYIPQNCANIIYAFALLDIQPPTAWLKLFSEACERVLLDFNQQNLTNAALAFTMLQLWELPLWRGFWDHLCQRMTQNIAEWNEEDYLNARQMYQAYQAASIERPGLLSAPEQEQLTAARKCWVEGLDTTSDRTSQLHVDVSDALGRLGVAHTNERWCERAERSIDIAIEGGATPIALEVDGPHHFLLDGRQNGSTLLRNRMLAAHGWRVVSLDFRKWEHKTQEQREAYLRSLLA